MGLFNHHFYDSGGFSAGGCQPVMDNPRLEPHLLHHLLSVRLTVMINGVDEPDSYVCVVVGHQNDVKQLFTLWVQLPQTSVHFLQSLSGYSNSRLRSSGQQKSKLLCYHLIRLLVYAGVTLTLTKGKAGPGAKGSVSCSIWYLRYSSTPFCSNTFCSRSVRNKTREETATVTAFSGFGCRKRKTK